MMICLSQRAGKIHVILLLMALISQQLSPLEAEMLLNLVLLVFLLCIATFLIGARCVFLLGVVDILTFLVQGIMDVRIVDIVIVRLVRLQ